jgi:hypothetical protein
MAYEGELRHFPTRESNKGTYKQRFHAVLSPHLPPAGARAHTREITATGADGVFVGVLRYTGRRFRFRGIIGVTTAAEGMRIERELTEIDGRAGELVISRSGREERRSVHVYGQAVYRSAQYVTADESFPGHVEYVAEMRVVEA